jgi:hypothetical protein
MNDTPPIIAAGIVEIIAENFGIKDNTIEKHAAIRITRGS